MRTSQMWTTKCFIHIAEQANGKWEPSVNTLSAEFWRYFVLSGRVAVLNI